MSYLVIARKWRPQDFSEVVGQAHVVKTLQNAIRSGRIAHAYLFTGARGVGKTSIARILAKAVNCLRGASPTPCNECSNCREITQGNSVDVVEIDGASNRGIDSIRELRETVRYRPAKSLYKIYIIDEVHMLTSEAFNALLKTLEEPPPHVLFIFATTEPHRMPATILSRCQRFDFRRIATGDLTAHLATIARKEETPLSDGVLYAVAQEADGSMRDAQSILEQLVAFSGDGLSDEEMLDVLGIVDRRSVFDACEAVLSGDAVRCLSIAANLHRRGIDSRRFIRRLCEHFRDILVVSLEAGADGPSRTDLPAEDLATLRNQAGRSSPESLHLLFQLAMKGEDEIRRSSMPRIGLEMLLLRMATLPALESLDAVLDRLAGVEKMLSGGGVRTLSREPGGASLPPRAEIRPAEPVNGVDLSPAVIPAKAGIQVLQKLIDPRLRGADIKSPSEMDGPPGPSPPDDAVFSSFVPDGAASSGISSGPEAPSAPVPDGEIAANWPRFLAWLDERDPFLAAKLTGSHAIPADDSPDTLLLEVNGIYEDGLRDSRSQSKLTEFGRGFFGRDFRWTVRSAAIPKKSTAPAVTLKSTQNASKRSVMEHPAVLQALEILGGELVEIRSIGEGPPKRRKENPDGGA